MNKNIENCLYQAGLTAQGCWDELDDYAREGIEKFAELIVMECERVVCDKFDETEPWMYPGDLMKHFGINKEVKNDND